MIVPSNPVTIAIKTVENDAFFWLFPSFSRDFGLTLPPRTL